MTDYSILITYGDKPANTIRQGAAAPSSSVGQDGDYYIDNTNFNLYGPKTAGAWTLLTSIVGPQGAAGADGASPQNYEPSGIYLVTRAEYDALTTYNPTSLYFVAETDGTGQIYKGEVLYSGSSTPLVLPTNTVLPVISGTAREGETITISQGTWTEADSYAYSLEKDGVEVDTDQSYTIPAGTAGESLEWTVTATNTDGSRSVTVSDTIEAALTAPSITSDPSFTGGSDPAELGETLTLIPGTVTGNPTPATTWQKLHDGADVGSTFSGNSYEIVSEDQGISALSFEQIETNSEGVARRVTSNVRAVEIDAPIDFDDDTFLYDFASLRNTYEDEPAATIAVLKELIRGNRDHDFINVNKQKQPFKTTEGGNFDEDSSRELTMRNPAGIANGTGGYYAGFNVKVDSVESAFMHITRAISDFASRGDMYATSSRLPRMYLNTSDDATSIQIGLATKALTLGEWYTVEYILDLSDKLTISITHDTEAAYSEDFALSLTPAVFPSSDPEQFVIGNRSNESSSLDGGISDFIFKNGVATAPQITNWRAYLQAQRD